MLYLKYLNDKLCTTYIATDDPRYTAARELALEAIREIEQQVEATDRAARYVWLGDYDEHGDPELAENDEPWEMLEEVTRLAARNPNVVAALEDQGRIDLVARYLGVGA